MTVSVEVWLPSGRSLRARVAPGSPWDRAVSWARYAGTERPRLYQRAPGDVVVDARGPARRRAAK